MMIDIAMRTDAVLEQSILGSALVFLQDVMAAKKLGPDKSLPWGLSPEGLAPGSMKVSKFLIF